MDGLIVGQIRGDRDSVARRQLRNLRDRQRDTVMCHGDAQGRPGKIELPGLGARGPREKRDEGEKREEYAHGLR